MVFNVLGKTYAMFFKTRMELGYKNSRIIAELSIAEFKFDRKYRMHPM